MAKNGTKRTLGTLGLTAALLISGIALAPTASAATHSGWKGCSAGTAVKLQSTALGASSAYRHTISGTSVATGGSYYNVWSKADGAKTHFTVTGAVSGSWVIDNGTFRLAQAVC